MSNIDQEEISNIDDIEFKLIAEGKLKESTKNSNHYINNKEFYNELYEYHLHKLDCLEKGKDIPPLTNKIGKAILQIATRRCNSHNYRGYSENWKEEMIANAVTLASLRGHNFDPINYSNPFAYFTQICDNGIKEQLKKEKTELYFKYKMIDNARGYAAVEDTEGNDPELNEEIDIGYDDRLKFINNYEESKLAARNKKKEENIDLGLFRDGETI